MSLVTGGLGLPKSSIVAWGFGLSGDVVASEPAYIVVAPAVDNDSEIAGRPALSVLGSSREVASTRVDVVSVSAMSSQFGVSINLTATVAVSTVSVQAGVERRAEVEGRIFTVYVTRDDVVQLA